MKNTVTLTIPFSFKGKAYRPSSVIDLDTVVSSDLGLDFLFHQVATENNIGHYSYEYEVLESSSKHFSDATGLAVEFLTENTFDFTGFKEKLNEVNVLDKLQAIALQHLNVSNLDESLELKQALLASYKIGKQFE